GDKGSIAATFNVALAEDEDAAAEIGWTTFGQDQGFAKDDGVVTVQSVVSSSPPIYTAGTRALDHVQVLADVFGRACAYWSFTGMKYARWQPLLVIGPSIARVIAADGWTKDDVRAYLHENVTIPAREVERYAWHLGSTAFSLKALAESGALPPEYAGSGDPDRPVRVFPRAAWIGIVVAGDPRGDRDGGVPGDVEGRGVRDHLERPGDVFLAARVRCRQQRRFQGQRRHQEKIDAPEGLVIRRPEHPGEVLRLRVVPAVIVVLHVLAEQDHQLHRLGELVRPGPTAPAVEVQKRGRVVSLPVRPHAVAGDHQHRSALDRDRVPDVNPVTMQGNGDLGHGG